jgi:hypothetical protein
MQTPEYLLILQVVALASSLVALGFTFNATGSKRSLHRACFKASILMPAVSLAVLYFLLGSAGHAPDALAELLPSGLTVASGITTAIHSFKFMG